LQSILFGPKRRQAKEEPFFCCLMCEKKKNQSFSVSRAGEELKTFSFELWTKRVVFPSNSLAEANQRDEVWRA
jgi:hypothetical protein